MATVPTPLDPAPGDKNSATAFDAGVRDVLNWLMTGYPRVHAYSAAGVAVPNSSGGTLITFDSEIYDTDNMHSTVSNTGRVTFTTAGLYRISIQISMPTATYSTLDMYTKLNANGVIGGGTTIKQNFYNVAAAATGNCFFNFTRFFNAGDYIEQFIDQTSGASRTCSGTSFGSRVQAEWIATV